MKWIKFSDRLPPNIEEAHMRYADGHEKLVYDSYGWLDKDKNKIRGEFDKETYTHSVPEGAVLIRFGQWGSGGIYEFKELEWLDESGPSAEEYFKAARVREIDQRDGDIGYLFETLEDYLKCIEK